MHFRPDAARRPGLRPALGCAAERPFAHRRNDVRRVRARRATDWRRIESLGERYAVRCHMIRVLFSPMARTSALDVVGHVHEIAPPKVRERDVELLRRKTCELKQMPLWHTRLAGLVALLPDDA